MKDNLKNEILAEFDRRFVQEPDTSINTQDYPRFFHDVVPETIFRFLSQAIEKAYMLGYAEGNINGIDMSAEVVKNNLL